jgi:hypothetical protein
VAKEVSVLLDIISDEERKSYEDKCIELATAHNVGKVHVCVQFKPETNERIVSYIKEPNYVSKLALMGKASELDMYAAGEELRLIYQIKEESHPLTYGETYDCEPYKLGVVQHCLGVITIVTNRFKKN